MPTPIWDTIASTMVDRVKAGTYQEPFVISKVLRPNQSWSNVIIEPWLCIVALLSLDAAEGDRENLEHGYINDGNPLAYSLRATYAVSALIMQSEKDEKPQDLIATQLICDLATAITTPADTWHTWGDLAILSRWKPVMNLSDNGTITEAGLLVEVDSRVSETAPYTFRA